MPEVSAPSAPAPSPGGSQPQSPPFGSTPVAGPTPNRGAEAAGLQALGVIVKMLEAQLAKLGSGSEPGQAVLKAITSLSKFVQPGSVSPAGTNNVLQAAQLQNSQNNAQIQALMAQRAKAAQGQGAPQGMPNA